MSASRAPVFSCAHRFQARLLPSACYAGEEKSWLSGTNGRSSLIVNQAKSTRILIFLRPRTFSHEFLYDKKQETEYNHAIISGGSSGGAEGLESPPISNLTLV